MRKEWERKRKEGKRKANEVAQYRENLEFKSLQGFRAFLQSHQVNVIVYPHFLALYLLSVIVPFDTVQSEPPSASFGNYTTNIYNTERETDVQKERK